MRHISSFFIKSSESFTEIILDAINHTNTSEPFKGEFLKKIKVTDDLSYIVYYPGNFPYHSNSFALAGEYFFIDDFLGTIIEKATNRNLLFEFYGILFSYMSHYFVVKKYTNNSFDGRALIDDDLEMIMKIDGEQINYLCQQIDYEHEDSRNEALKLIEIDYFLTELNLSWQEFEQLTQKCLNEGEVIWPKEILSGTEDEITPNYPIIPMFK